MSRYFSKFPTISYSKTDVRDITRRNNFVERNLSNPYMFLPYTVKENEKPEDIALYYYGSVDYTWLVLLANNMLDPYHDWALPQEEFHKYLIKKYAEEANKTGYDVVDWTQNETINDNILYYYKDLDNSTPAEGSYTVSDLDSIDITQEQMQELFDDEIVTINGITYRLVKE